MKRNAVKFLMFISSYFPLYVMMLILYFDKIFLIYNNKLNFGLALFFLMISLCIIWSIFSIQFLRKGSNTKSIQIQLIERPDDTIISYMMTYMIPILTTATNSNNAIIINIVLFLLIGYLYVRLNLLYLNPLWSVLGFMAYKINSDVIVITDIDYAELKQKKETEIIGYYLANDIFVAKRESQNY